MTGIIIPDAFNMQLTHLTDLTMHGIGLILFYLLTICLVVFFFSEFYMDTYQINRKERWIMVALGFAFGLLDMWLGDARIFFPVWGLLSYLFVVDLKYQELPDGVNALIALLALPIVILAFFEPTFWSSTLLTGVVLFVLFLLISLVGGMGGGDIKLMGAVGLYFPFFEFPQLIVFGFGVGVLHAIGVLFQKDVTLKTKFAFGPGLIIGVLLTSLL